MENQKNILRKIKRCLALSNSSNPNEAATALRQAQALMRKHGITSETVAASDVSSFINKSSIGNRKPPIHIAYLIDVIRSAFGVQFVWKSQNGINGWKSCIEFYGIGSSAEIASYAFDVLLRQLKRDRAAYLSSLHKNLKKANKTLRANLYAEGWICSVREKIVPYEHSSEEENAIAAYKANRWSNLIEINLKESKNMLSSKEYSAYMEGIVDGKNIDFYQGVHDTKNTMLN